MRRDIQPTAFAWVAAMVLLNRGATLDVIMKTAGRGSASFRAYMMFRLAEESDLEAALLQIQNLTLSEFGGDQPSEISKSPYEPPIGVGAGDSSSSESAGSTSRYAGVIWFSPLRQIPSVLGAQ